MAGVYLMYNILMSNENVWQDIQLPNVVSWGAISFPQANISYHFAPPLRHWHNSRPYQLPSSRAGYNRARGMEAKIKRQAGHSKRGLLLLIAARSRGQR